jgi:signal recognition particle subunit SRP54
LQVIGRQAGVPVYAPEPGNGVGDPVAVARQSLDEARRTLHNIVIIDTAGRLGIDEVLMSQAAAIRDAVSPDETLFVLDAMIGQDAVATAEAFGSGVGFTGVVLTKLDGDARGGAALSVREVTGQPIMFASNGEKLEDFDVFHPDRMASRILGMGDLLTLIEQAEQAFDAEQTARTAAKIGTGELTLEDFLEQMLAIRKMGPIGNILGMLPGANQMKEQLAQVDDRQLDTLQAIIRGMTPAERADPKIINGSRRLRIASGSGTTVGEVSQLVTNFFEGQKQMKQMLGGAMPGMPGMMGAGARRAAKAAAKSSKKGKRRSGDPRKAALAASGGGQGGQGGQGGDQQAAQAQAQQAPASMEELAEMLRDAQAAGAAGGQGGDNGFAGFRGGPSALPQFPGAGLPQGNVPAAFGKRNNKKKK